MRGDPVERFFCPDCACETASRVVKVNAIRRRRECLQCGRRFNTREIEEDETRDEPHHRPLIGHPELPF